MKNLIISIWGVGLGFFASAQDTLPTYRQLQQHPLEPEQLQLCLRMAEQCQSVAPQRAQYYALKALQLARQTRQALAEGEALIDVGNACMLQGQYAQALQHMDAARQVFDQQLQRAHADELRKAQTGAARALGSLGIIFAEQSQYAKALGFHLNALKRYQAVQQPDKVAKVRNNIAIAYMAMGQPAKALPQLTAAYAWLVRHADGTLPQVSRNIGQAYFQLGRFAQTQKFYALAQQQFKKFPNARGEGELYNNMAEMALSQKQYPQALQALSQARQAFATIQDRFGLADTEWLTARVYAAQKQWSKVVQHAQLTLHEARAMGVWEQISGAEALLQDAYAQLGQYAQAWQHAKAYGVAKDSLNNQENIRLGIQAELTAAFDKRELERQKAHEKQQLLWEARDSQHRLELWFTVIALLLGIGLVFVLYNRHQLKKTLVLQKELAEYEQKALHLQMNPHFVFNCLGSISSFIVQNGTDSAIKYLAKFSKLMRLTLEYSKEAIIPLRKELESLQNYLELEQLRFHRKFDFQIIVAEEVEDDMGIPPLMIQPLVENAIVHGVIPKGSQGLIMLKFSVQNQLLCCEITDNGVGLHASQQRKQQSMAAHKSMALDILRKRLDMLKAKTGVSGQLLAEEITEHGTPAGTRVLLQLPIL